MRSSAFKMARDFLLENRTDGRRAVENFRWPEPTSFNWAQDWFDAELARGSLSDKPALYVLGEQAEEVSFAEMAARSSRVANGLRRLGVRRGDRILLMTGVVTPHWETMLAAIKLGAIVIPSTLLLTADDLAERVGRARVRCVIVPMSETHKFPGLGDSVLRVCFGDPPSDWTSFASLYEASEEFEPDAETRPDDPMLLYFTSGTTSRPKMVLHSHRSYTVGHLSTMYWIGARPGERHMAIGAPGWAGHSYMALFGPWNAGATIVVLNQSRFDARAVLDALVEHRVDTFFAPPTVWRMLLQQDLSAWPVVLREAVSGGEPLNPEVIEQVQRMWGVTIRDGWGQTEMTSQIANVPAQPVNLGAMGCPLPGCSVAILDEEGREVEEGELALPMSPRPPGLMLGYLEDDDTLQPIQGPYFRTGDAVQRNPDGTYGYVGRVDDVFKSSGYRISPFELESVLVEHPAVVEAAVVPSPDPLRLVVPKAFIALAAAHEPTRDTAASIFRHIRDRLAPYKRVRRIAFTEELPKTVSGKIRRAELRRGEAARGTTPRPADEFREEDVLSITRPE
jgi:acetyl-CoA synthetase